MIPALLGLSVSWVEKNEDGGENANEHLGNFQYT